MYVRFSHKFAPIIFLDAAPNILQKKKSDNTKSEAVSQICELCLQYFSQQSSPCASNARGLVFGHIYTQSGQVHICAASTE
jgi:hypothetical protein